MENWMVHTILFGKFTKYFYCLRHCIYPAGLNKLCSLVLLSQGQFKIVKKHLCFRFLLSYWWLASSLVTKVASHWLKRQSLSSLACIKIFSFDFMTMYCTPRSRIIPYHLTSGMNCWLHFEPPCIVQLLVSSFWIQFGTVHTRFLLQLQPA